MADLVYDGLRSELLPFVPPGVGRLLDVGCSTGLYGAELREQRPGLEVWGIEPEPASAKVARQHLDHVIEDVFPAAPGALPSHGFDVITFNDVLEHMLEPGDALRAAGPLLAPGGTVLASIPNIRHFSVLWPLVRHGRWDYHEAGLLDRTHVRFFTRASMESLFTDNGFQVDSIVGVNRRLQWWHKAESPSLRRVRRLTRGRLDDFFYVQYVVTARPAADSQGSPTSQNGT